MRNFYLFILFTCISFNLFAMKIEGNPESWSKEDFIGFDEIGDCLSRLGDISSVFSVISFLNCCLVIFIMLPKSAGETFFQFLHLG